uniref:Reverse transcriptase domain-containing protein n=1 Tax=Romanomermis culicivorax TaxID=13658 RepID=A0A915HHK2_ROMCU
MQTVLSTLWSISYLDDILMFSSMAMQHNERLRAVLQHLSDKDFCLNIAECQSPVTDVPRTFDMECQHQAQPEKPQCNPKCADPAVNH